MGIERIPVPAGRTPIGSRYEVREVYRSRSISVPLAPLRGVEADKIRFYYTHYVLKECKKISHKEGGGMAIEFFLIGGVPHSQ